jgi:hypothetical protein
MNEDSRANLAGWLVASVATMMAMALLFAGWIAGEPIRLVIQTLPLWVVTAFGFAGAGYVRWAAFPVLLFWTALAAILWVDHMGWVHLAGGAYSSVEVRVTGLVAAAGALGLLACLGKHERTSPLTGLTLALACGALQIGAYYFGLTPSLT